MQGRSINECCRFYENVPVKSFLLGDLQSCSEFIFFAWMPWNKEVKLFILLGLIISVWTLAQAKKKKSWVKFRTTFAVPRSNLQPCALLQKRAQYLGFSFLISWLFHETFPPPGWHASSSVRRERERDPLYIYHPPLPLLRRRDTPSAFI